MLALAASSNIPATLVALFVGVISGVTASLITGHFQSRSTERTLQAEKERLDKRLSFERGESDRRELRTIIDGLAEQLLLIHDQVARADGAAAQLLRLAKSGLTEWTQANVDLSKHLEPIHVTSRTAGDFVERLRLRLGPEGQELTARAAAIRDSAGVAIENSPRVSDEAVESLAAQREQISEQRNRFIEEARKFTATHLHAFDTQE